MSRSRHLPFVVSALVSVLISLPGPYAFAEVAKVPITYPGDTKETLARRAQWIEGAKKEGGLIWWSIGVAIENMKILQEFNNVYPFAKVEQWRGTGEEMATKVEAEFSSRRYTVDILRGAERNHYPRWRGMGMMAKFTDVIPGIEKFDKGMYSKYGDWAMPGVTVGVPMYNPKLVSAAEAPKNWEDLTDPKWKGHITLSTDMKIWSILALAEGGWGINKTEDFLRKLKNQNIHWVQGRRTGFALLQAGGYKIMGDAYLHYILHTQGTKDESPIDWVRANPIPAASPAFFMLKTAPHPNTARLFLEWLFSPPGLQIFEKITAVGSPSPDSGTKLAKALTGSTLITRDEEGDIKAVEMDLDARFAKILGVTPE